MANSDLSVGDIVKLSPDSRYARQGRDNPIGCTGEVINTGERTWLTVRWSNGTRNGYQKKDSDLILIESA